MASVVAWEGKVTVPFQTVRPIPDSLLSAKAILQPREAKAEEAVLPLVRVPCYKRYNVGTTG